MLGNLSSELAARRANVNPVCVCLCFCLCCLQAEGEDNLKKMQLMELAILNGTYRDTNLKTRKRAHTRTHTRAHTHTQPTH